MLFIIDNILLLPMMLIVTFQPIGHLKTSTGGFAPKLVHLEVVVAVVVLAAVAAMAAVVVVVVPDLLVVKLFRHKKS